MQRISRTFLAGLMAALPLLLTIFVLAWLISFLNQYAGPSSAFGAFLVSLGLAPNTHEAVSYLVGIAASVAIIYGLGLIVESRIGDWLARLADRLIRRVPIVSYLYDLANRVVSMLDGRTGQGLQDMKPVWCFFGGRPGAAVFALLPTSTPVVLGDEKYLAVLVPSAPVPFGGALIYVPEAWIEPAAQRVDDLVSVYMSMGLQVPVTPQQNPTIATPPGEPPNRL
ncbi:MAG: DUF502 domain-containing protein [Alphaproteobacteria bacterium]|nr:DUF502 domain-containing protein [Alphaproteobacteria bacterium]